jgi:hypothetical protein
MHLWIHHLAHSSFLLSWAEKMTFLSVCEVGIPGNLYVWEVLKFFLCTTIFHIGFSEIFVLNVIRTTGASLRCNLTGRTGGTFWKVVKFYVQNHIFYKEVRWLTDPSIGFKSSSKQRFPGLFGWFIFEDNGDNEWIWKTSASMDEMIKLASLNCKYGVIIKF